ncbi:MAG TPA: sulfotransferase [Lysobacter sp.]
MQLIVLGMHRSGTSVLARLLNLMGVYFGPEGMSTGANQENPKGFWERRDVRALNDSVLHAVGCDWNRVLKLDVAALPQPVVADFNKRASKLLLEMDAHRPWLLKEPRLCLLLPLWRKWLEVPVCIHIYRNPVEVASSLHKRNGIPMEAGLALWERYVRSALDASEGLPSVAVSHRQLMEEPAVAIAKLLEGLNGAGVPGLRMPTGREIEAFVEDGLYRERESREDLHPYARARQLRLFRTLEAGRRPTGRTSQHDADEAALARFEAGLPPIELPPSEEKVPDITEVTLRGQLALREQEIQFVREMSGKHEADVRQRDERLAGIEREHQQARETAARLEVSLGQRDARLQEMERDGQALRDTIARLEADVRQRDERLAAMGQELAGLREAAMRREELLQQEATGLRETITRHEAEAGVLRQAVTALEAVRGEVVELQSALDQREARLAALEQQLVSTEATGRAAREETTRLQSQLQTHEDESRLAKAELQRLAQEARTAGEARLRAEKSIEARYQELAKLTQLLIAREQDLAKATSDLDETGRQLELAQKARASAEAELAGIRQSRIWRLLSPMGRVVRRFRRSGSDRRALQDVAALRQSGLFDEAWYLRMYPDVARAGFDAVEHFLRFGAAERRNPGPGFDTAAYLRNNPDVSGSGLNPLLHYINHGKLEGRSPK